MSAQKTVYQFNKNCKLIKQYASIAECARKMKIIDKNLYAIMRAKTLRKRKYYFSLEPTFVKPVLGKRGNPQRPPKTVYQFDMYGKFIDEFKHADITARTLKIKRRTICKVIQDRSIHDKKFYFSYDINFKPDIYKPRSQNPLHSGNYIKGLYSQKRQAC